MKTKDRIKKFFHSYLEDEYKASFIDKAYTVLKTNDESEWDVKLKEAMASYDTEDSDYIISRYTLAETMAQSKAMTFDEWFYDPETLAESEMWGRLAEEADKLDEADRLG